MANPDARTPSALKDEGKTRAVDVDSRMEDQATSKADNGDGAAETEGDEDEGEHEGTEEEEEKEMDEEEEEKSSEEESNSEESSSEEEECEYQPGHLDGGADVAPHGILTGAAARMGICKITPRIKKGLAMRGIHNYRPISKEKSDAPQEWDKVVMLVPVKEVDSASWDRVLAQIEELDKLGGVSGLHEVDFTYWAKANGQPKDVVKACEVLRDYQHPDETWQAELPYHRPANTYFDRSKVRKGDIDHSVNPEELANKILGEGYEPEEYAPGWYKQSLEEEEDEGEGDDALSRQGSSRDGGKMETDE
ncbi:hypothetical protein JCM8547_005009 [Rhodosporidiobolus lusitaniae]